MSAELKLDTKGLDRFGKSTLTWSELACHMASVETLCRFDAALHGVAFESARLCIRRDGTYVVFPERDAEFVQALSSTSELIDAMTKAAVNPGAEAAAQLEKAEMEFSDDALVCITRAIREACRSEETEFTINTENGSIPIKLPHKSTLQHARMRDDPKPRDGGDKIKKVNFYFDTASYSGLAVLIKRNSTTPAIKAGDKVIVKLIATVRRFFRINSMAPRNRS